MQLYGIIFIVVYIQLSGIEYTSTFYTTPILNIALADYIQPSRKFIHLGVYHLSTTYAIFADYTQPLTKLVYLAVYQLSFTSQLSTAMVNTSIYYSKKLSNLVKIPINNAKYNGRNDSFIFKLAIFHDICLRVDVLPKAKIEIFFTILKDLALN